VAAGGERTRLGPPAVGRLSGNGWSGAGGGATALDRPARGGGATPPDRPARGGGATPPDRPRTAHRRAPAPPAREPYALFTAAASSNPSRAIASSRILNFCTFPVTVIGKASVNTTYRGTL